MANQCPANTRGSAFSADWYADRTDWNKQPYADRMVSLLEDLISQMTTRLSQWGQQDWTPGPYPNIDITYPGFGGFTDLRPVPEIHPYEPPEPVDRPLFIDLDRPNDPNIPPYDIPNHVTNFPDAPDDSVPVFTGTTPVVDTITKPTAPTYTLPSDPVLYYPDIPIVPEFAFTQFTEEFVDTTFVEPASYVDPGPNNYQSTLADAIKDKLEHDVINGGTGLADDVEDAIWRREEERSLIAHYDAMDQIADAFGRRGFIMPPQMLSGALMVEKTNYVNKRLDMSRDIAIKQAELAQTNTHFVIDKGIEYEKSLMEMYERWATRVFEAAKATVGFGVEVYRAQIERYNSSIQIYRTKADVWKMLIEGEIAKMQGWLAQIEGAKAQIEMSRMNVEVYRAKMEAIKLLVDTYVAEMNGAKISTDIERLKIETFKAEIDAYVAHVNGKTAEFNLYATEVDAEKAKISAWATLVDTYKARVDAAKAAIDANTAYINAQATYNKSLAEVYSSDIEGYKAEIQAEVSQVDSSVRVYEGKVKGYEADARAYEAMGNLEVKVIDAKLEEFKIETDAKVEYLKLDLAAFLDYWKIFFGVYETEAQVVAQVAAAALNADSTSYHFSDSNQTGESQQTSCIDYHYYEETTV